MTGGALNAVAGGGSFLALPALIFAGVPPVAANATTTFALWPGSISSAWAYRREIARTGRAWLVLLGSVSLAGGLTGGFLLMQTSDAGFMRLLPWLMLVAAATFTFAGRVSNLLRRRRSGREPARPRIMAPSGALAPTASEPFPLWALPLQLTIAVYGGYFGGGIGIMMLATLAVSGMTDMHEMNGLKALLAVAINGVALAEFIAHGAVAWGPGIVMVAGAILGGYSGATIARRLPGPFVRSFVIVVAWLMTAYFFVRSLS